MTSWSRIVHQMNATFDCEVIKGQKQIFPKYATGHNGLFWA